MRTAVKIVTVLLVVFLIWNIYVYIFGKDTTTLAVVGTISDYVSAEGHLIKNETLIKAPSDGVLQPYVSDCEKVGKGMTMAAVLSGETDEAARSQMTEIKSRISALEDSLANGDSFKDDILSIDASIDENISDIVKYASRGKMINIKHFKNEIIMLSDRRNTVIGDNGQQILSSLKAQKLELESRLGNIINEIRAPVSGVFTARTDGLEEKLMPSRLDEITVAEIDSIKNLKPVTQTKVLKGDVICKLIDNFEWFLAVALNAEDTNGLEEGKYIKIAFRDADREKVSSYIQRVSPPENGKVLVIFRLNYDLNGILHNRHVSIDIVKSTNEGFRLPIGALCVVDNKTGVYVKNGAEKKFCEVEVLYRNDGYMIVKEDNTKSGGLLLFDNVVISGAKND